MRLCTIPLGTIPLGAIALGAIALGSTFLGTPSLGRPTHEVLGWHPHDAGAAQVNYEWQLLSTIAFHAIELDGRGHVANWNGWPDLDLIEAARIHAVRPVLGVTVPSRGETTTLLLDSDNRHRAVVLLVAAVTDAVADGIALDIESVPGEARAEFVAFVQELGGTLKATIPGAYLAVTLPGWDWEEAYDAPGLALSADYLILRTDVCRWSNAPATGPVTPLAGWGSCNASRILEGRLDDGVPARSLLLGIAYYGYRWPCASGDPGAATTGEGTRVRYEDAQGEAEIHGRLWDAEGSTPWYRYAEGAWRQGWYDDATSLGAKYDLALRKDLGGVALHFLGYDGSRTELWDALSTHFGPGAAPVWSAQPNARWVVWPNPSSGPVTFAGNAAPLEIVDCVGRRVRLLAATGGVTTWDGRDDRGRVVPRGVYLARGSGGAVRVTRLY